MHWTSNIPDQRFTGGLEIAADLACVQCGYNLRALPADGRCPECGTPARTTLEQSEDRSKVVNPLREHAGSWFTAMSLTTLSILTFPSCLGAVIVIILVPIMGARLFTAFRVIRMGFARVDLGAPGAQRLLLMFTQIEAWVGIGCAAAVALMRLATPMTDPRIAVMTMLPWWIVNYGEGFLIGLIAARSRETLGYRWIEIVGFITVFAVPLAALFHSLVVLNAVTSRPGPWLLVLLVCWPLGTALPAMTLAYIANALSWLTEPSAEVLRPAKTSPARTRTASERDPGNAPISLEES